MSQHIGQLALLVHDYDEAIAFYTQKLSFDLLEDTRLSATKRWVRVAPRGSAGFSLLLAHADSDEQRSRVGNQTGGRVFLFLYTDDFWRDYNAMRAAGVLFSRDPVEEPYGTVAVFADLYGNLWDMIQPM
ncbi:catechol 2,3-dioxygenase-like lactoylglutathione lyase family enzyme [Spirosoma oryzae]|uniref:Catechol 2,3-dioxygenase-like lactoylglutathione lyase family enzyme n=1 Tax=Spirosoma oryzae TaxID=1469603 RepID=A0A2T0TBP2_9BACT|nr:VOC family protein [Spirosoma oryzae]PRY43080.1 catechol 2,3-dioxygenase-like lactoylglutathione lyase family enzyme [Spirosoma oryzae]